MKVTLGEGRRANVATQPSEKRGRKESLARERHAAFLHDATTPETHNVRTVTRYAKDGSLFVRGRVVLAGAIPRPHPPPPHPPLWTSLNRRAAQVAAIRARVANKRPASSPYQTVI